MGLNVIHTAFDADQVEWTIPDLSIISTRQAPPELRDELLGSASRLVRDAAERANAPAEYVLGGLLAVTGALLAQSRTARAWPGWSESPVLWFALVGDPSAGKTPALSEVLAAADAVEKIIGDDFDNEQARYVESLERSKAAKDAWKESVREATKLNSPTPTLPSDAIEPEAPVQPRIVVRDTTSEKLILLAKGAKTGILMVRDELRAWLGSFDRYTGGGGDRGLWNESYNGRPHTVDRVKQGGSIRVDRLTIGVLGGLQPEILTKLLLNDSDDGLCARFVMVFPDRVPPKRPTIGPGDERLTHAFRRLANLNVEIDDEGKSRPRAVEMTPESQELFQKWRVEHERDFAAGMLSSAFGKMPGLVLRLSLAFSYLDWALTEGEEPTSISGEVLARTLEFVDEFVKPMLRRAYGDSALPPAERNAAVVGRMILARRCNVINERECYRSGLPGIRDAETARKALMALVEHRWLKPRPTRAGTHPGRARADYLVNPLLWEGGDGPMG